MECNNSLQAQITLRPQMVMYYWPFSCIILCILSLLKVWYNNESYLEYNDYEVCTRMIIQHQHYNSVYRAINGIDLMVGHIFGHSIATESVANSRRIFFPCGIAGRWYSITVYQSENA